jgi:hypothetical protein
MSADFFLKGCSCGFVRSSGPSPDLRNVGSGYRDDRAFAAIAKRFRALSATVLPASTRERALKTQHFIMALHCRDTVALSVAKTPLSFAWA